MFKCEDSKFIEIVANSISLAQVIRKCGLVPAGGNYRSTKERIKKLKLDTSHFTGQAHNKGKKLGPKQPIESYLQNNVKTSSNHLKNRLIREEYFEHKCYKCNLTTWNDLPIPIELEHIDGNHMNNNLSNLTILCPNCHAQTDTYRGKNIKIKRRSENTKPRIRHRSKKRQRSYEPRFAKPKEYKYCIDCNKKCSDVSTRCKSCAQSYRMKDVCKRPSKEQLLTDKKELVAFTKIGKKYNVSDNAVRKWFKFYQILQ